MRSAAWWKQWKEAELRPSAGRHPLPRARNEKRMHGTTALRGSFTRMRHLGARRGVKSDMRSAWWTQWKEAELLALRGSLTQNPDLGAGVGPGPARGALAVDARKKRSYDPDPPSRSEKWDLERQGAMHEDAMEAAELRPCEGYSVPGLATSPSTSTTVGSSCSTIK